MTELGNKVFKEVMRLNEGIRVALTQYGQCPYERGDLDTEVRREDGGVGAKERGFKNQPPGASALGFQPPACGASISGSGTVLRRPGRCAPAALPWEESQPGGRGGLPRETAPWPDGEEVSSAPHPASLTPGP